MTTKSSSDLRARRKALGWSQNELAAALGVAGPTVSRWELGRMKCGHANWLEVMLGSLEFRQRMLENAIDPNIKPIQW
jgi:transcriptional regulator with XRE-family HTH domain